MEPLLTIDLDSADDAIALGRALGQVLVGGETICLIGQLGAGKTTFTKGLALGLGLSDPGQITSPTFVLIIEHRGGRLDLIHIDLYRLDCEEADELGLEEYFGAENAVCAVEWPERAEELLPTDRLTIKLTVTGPDARRAELTAEGEKASLALAALKTELQEGNL